MLRTKVRLVLGRAGPSAEEVAVLEERVERAEAEAEEDAGGGRSAGGAGFDDFSAGGAFRVLEDAMLLHDERAAQWNHEQDAEIAADQGEHEDAEVFEVEAEEDERRKGKDDAGGDGLAGVSAGLDDDGFKDRRLALVTKGADGDDGDGDGGGDRESGAQAHIHGDRAEDEAEKRAQQHGANVNSGGFWVAGIKG